MFNIVCNHLLGLHQPTACVSILCCSQSLVDNPWTSADNASLASLMDLQNSHRELNDLNPLGPQIVAP